MKLTIERVMAKDQELILLRKSILKELDGYRYIIHTLFKEEFFYTKQEIKYHKDPVIKKSNPWPLCEFIDIKLKGYTDFSDELLDLLHLRENSKRYHIYEEASKFKLIVTTNFDLRDLYSELFTMYDHSLVHIDLINEYQFSCTITEKNSYYSLKNDLKDLVEDFFKPKRQKQFESQIINTVRFILNNEVEQ